MTGTMISEDHQTLIQAVRDYARGELLAHDREWDRTETSCCELLDQYAEMGLLGLRVPEEDGGLGLPMLPYAHILRELSYASPSVAVMVSVHSMVCDIIMMYAAEGVRRKLLHQLGSRGNLSAFAISEPDAGSDPTMVRTRAEKVPGGWKLTGPKMWVTNGVTGNWFAVLARTDKSGTHKDLSMLLMDATAPGVERTQIHGKLGIRASETAEMSLDGVFVPEENMLGAPGDGMRVALSALDGGRIGIASQAVGIGQACLDEMVNYSKQRVQFQQPICDFQAIQWMIADSAVELDGAQLLIDRAAVLKEEDQPFTKEASMAKLFASEAANRIAYRAVQVHGGSGYCHDFRVEQLYRDARITTIYEGTSEIQRYVIARSLLKEPD